MTLSNSLNSLIMWVGAGGQAKETLAEPQKVHV